MLYFVCSRCKPALIVGCGRDSLSIFVFEIIRTHNTFYAYSFFLLNGTMFFSRMEAIQALSDAQLRDELIKHGMKNLGPVMGTSRGIYEKKLFKLKQGAVSDKTKTKVRILSLLSNYVQAEPTPAPASTSKTVKSTSRATRSTKKVVQKSESEGKSCFYILAKSGIISKQLSERVLIMLRNSSHFRWFG